MLNLHIFNNPISHWLIAISLFVLTFIVGRVSYWILSRWIKRLTQKTETKLDDIIIDMLEEPFAFAVVLLGMRYSLSWLILPDTIATWPEDGFQFLIAVTVAWFAVRLYDALQQHYLVPLAKGVSSEFYTQFVPVVDTGIKFGGVIVGLAVGLHRANYDVEAVIVTSILSVLFLLLAARHALFDILSSIKSFFAQAVAVQHEKSIHKQVYNVILLLCFASLFVTLFLGFRFYQEATQREKLAFDEAESNAQAVVDYITQEMAHLQTVVDTIATDLTDDTLPKDQLANRLRTTVEQNPQIYGVGAAFEPYTYKSHTALYSPYFVRDVNGELERRQVEDSYNYTDATNPDAAWFTETMASGDRWLTPFYAPAPQAWLAPYHALFYENNKPIGLIAGIHSLETLADLVKQLDLGEEGYSFILAGDGTFIAHPTPNFLGTTIYSQAANFDDNILIRDAERALSGEDFWREGQDLITGEDAWLFYSSVPSAGWVIGVVLNKQTLVAAPTTIKRNLIHILLSVIAFLLFLSILVFQADRGKPFRLWSVSITTALLFTGGIALICTMEFVYPSRNNSQVVLMNKTTLNKELNTVVQNFQRDGQPPPLQIPTGIMIETVTIDSTTENIVTGYIWQKYPLDLPDDIDKEIILPDVPDPEGLALEEMYRFQRGNVEVIGWTFRAKLKQQPQVAKYPFDEAEIQIQIWPKSLNKNIVLVPDLDEYQFTNPTQTPGLVESLVLEDWTVKRSFFGYRYNKYNATFGSSQVIKKFNIPDLSFNIDIRRNILSPMVAYAITLSVVMALMFAVMVIHAETSFNVLSYAAALFFVVAVTHVGLRSELNTHDVVYLEHGFIIMYLVLLSVSINSMIFYSSINVPIVQYQDNLIPKLLYWPALQGILLAITISVFYPAVNPAEALDTVRHHHASGVTPIAAAPKELVPAVTGTPEPSIALTDQTTLRLALSKDPTTLDPSRANDTISTDQIGNLFMGLTRIDIDTGQVLPSLATAWSASEDGLEWTFTLRQDIPWGQYNPQTGQAAQVIDFDGQPRSVNARDVVYGIQRALMSDNSSAPLLYIIKNAREINTNQTADGQPTLLIAEDIGVEAIDDRTVKFTLETPAAYLPALLAYPITYPLPKWAIDEWADLWTEPARINTSGPYLLHSWDRGQQITLIKNPLWVEADQIQIERLRQPIIPQAEDRLALYKNNELDLLEKLQDVEAVKADPALNAELEFYPLLCTTYLGFVHTKPPFNDVRIRRAFSAAIDREAIAELLDGGGIPATSLAPPGVFGAPAPGTVGQGYDPDLARESLQEFLDERGFTIEEFNDTYQITYGTSGQLSDFESAIMEMWADILGVEVTPNTLPWSEYKNVVEKNTPIESMYHIYQYTWYADYPDENNWVHELFNSEVGMNRLRRNCADPNCQETTGPTRFDELTIAAGQNNQPEERIKLYAEAEKILAVDEAAYAPIYHCARSALTKPWLNRTYPRLGAPNYWTWNVDVEKQQEGKNKQSE